MSHIEMITVFVLAALISVIAADLPDGFPKTNRQKLNLNIGWQYHLGDAANSPETIDYDDNGWATVNLPHTYKLTSINQ